jgi:hypothetical protein
MANELARPYWHRLLIAFVASFVLVFACSLSMQLHSLRDPHWVLAIALGVAIAASPSSAISALVFRRGPLSLILGSQIFTVVALATWFAARA